MQDKLTLTIDEEVYDGLRRVIGPRKISHFVEELVCPHVLKKDLYEGYRAMSVTVGGPRTDRGPSSGIRHETVDVPAPYAL